MYNTADAFFVSGSVFKHKLIRMGISKKKRFYIETMIADDRYINDFSIENKLNTLNCNNSPIIFLFMSRITKGKGMCLAIDIFNIIQNMNERKMELIMAGDGDKLRVTKNYVKENNIKNIVFTGYVKDMKKHELLKKSHITLFPTMYGEGIPNTILEGTLYGMPIISRINAGIPDWISNGINGFLTESTNPYDFVPFIEKLLISSELYENIAMNNHNLALNNFTKTVITKRFFHHYREVYGS